MFLRVQGRREDGYHEIESAVLPLSLADQVVVAPADRLRLSVRGPESLVSEIPVDESNLALRAAVALAQECPQASGALIDVDKHIPVAAGLGGGSADAAAAISALNELWGCGLGDEELAAVAAKVGSDVPALLADRPVLIRGRGEEVRPITVAPMWWVLVPFDFPVLTADAYAWWDDDGEGPGPNPSALLEAAGAGGPDAVAALLFNDLEGPVCRRYPAVTGVKTRLLAGGALGALMCGSGPTVAGLAESEEHGHEIAGRVGSERPGGVGSPLVVRNLS
jgi:4-diphosphocytidyl-2-C-methyl-D-erythritol kinase